MAKIFISTNFNSERDHLIYKEISSRLIRRGHEIVDEFEIGKDLEISIRNNLNQADVIIPIITKYSLESNFFMSEIAQFKNYSAHINKLLIPIIDKGVEYSKLPLFISTLLFLQLNHNTDSEYELIIQKIDESINLYLGKRIAVEEKAQELKNKIEDSAPTYISKTILELEKRENFQKQTAFFWYFLGFVSLLSGVVVAVWFSNNGLSNFNGQENWSLTIFFAIKSLAIIILLIAASKYCFNLAKSYMSESLKIADRIHAISFGKFYLQIFNQQIDPSEIKDIFRDWNINNQSNNFSSQTAADYDPKLLERIVEILDKLRKNDK